MRFSVDVENEVELVQKELQRMQASVNSRVTERGFRPLARPSIPDVIRGNLTCIWNGKKYKLNSPKLEGVPEDELIPIPPTDVSRIDQEVLGHLILYFTAEVSWLACELHDLRYEKDTAERLTKRTLNMIKYELRDATNPRTGKRMSDTMRRETAEQDNRYMIREEAAFQKKMEYQRAQAIYDGRVKIVEALNRVRAGRSDEIRRTNYVPGGHRELGSQQEESRKEQHEQQEKERQQVQKQRALRQRRRWR